MADELKSCPFCGGKASISDGSNGLHFRVICNKSACRAAGPLERCAVDAKDAWNTRASSRPADQVPDMVERVFAAIQREASPGNMNFSEREIKSGVRAALQAVPAASEVGWQPIEMFNEPTSPGSGDGVLVADRDGTVGEAYFRNFGDRDDGWWWVNTNWGDYPEPDRPTPTHYRPLPEPPALKASGEEG